MKSIFTKYIPVTNTKPARIKAFDSEKRFSVTITGSSKEDHLLAVKKLKDKLNWTGKMICGDSGSVTDGIVCVFEDNEMKVNPILTRKKLKKNPVTDNIFIEFKGSRKAAESQASMRHIPFEVVEEYRDLETDKPRVIGKVPKEKKHSISLWEKSGDVKVINYEKISLNPVKMKKRKNPIDPFTKKRVKRKPIKQKAGGTVSYPEYFHVATSLDKKHWTTVAHFKNKESAKQYAKALAKSQTFNYIKVFK